MIDDFLPIYFIFARFCEFQKLFKKIKAKELLKEGSKGTDVNESRFVLNIDVLIVRFITALKLTLRIFQMKKTAYNFSVSLLINHFYSLKKKAKLFECEKLKSFYFKLKVFQCIFKDSSVVGQKYKLGISLKHELARRLMAAIGSFCLSSFNFYTNYCALKFDSAYIIAYLKVHSPPLVFDACM
jgi:hypothetical protein